MRDSSFEISSVDCRSHAPIEFVTIAESRNSCAPAYLFLQHIYNKVTMASSLGVPVKLLHESLGHVITVELKTGQLYRGKLAEGMYLYNCWRYYKLIAMH